MDVRGYGDGFGGVERRKEEVTVCNDGIFFVEDDLLKAGEKVKIYI